MKAAWTCRACSRRLQASQTSRPGLQVAATRQSPQIRYLTSEASAVGPPAADTNRRNAVASRANSSRFTQAPIQPKTPDPKQGTRDLADEQLLEDPFEAAFKARRDDTGGRKKQRGKPKKSSEDDTPPPWPFELSQRRMIPEDLTSLEISQNSWRVLCGEIRKGKKPKWLVRDEVKWVEELKPEGIRELWIDMTATQRQQLWNQLMLTTVLKHPEKAPMVLSATLMDPLPPLWAFNDILHFILVALHSRNSNLGARVRRDMVEQTHQATLHYINANLAETTPIRLSSLGRLAYHLSSSQVSKLHNAVKDRGTPLPSDTILRIASKLSGLRASDDHREEAFQMLQVLVSRGENLMDPKIASVITSLLHQKYSGEQSSFAPMQVLQYFMENGFLPNAITITALVETLCERDEFPEAMNLVKLFANNGLRLDAKACSVLLKGAQHTGSDEHMEEALEFSKAVGAPQNLLANHAIHALYLRIQDEVRQAASLRPDTPWLYEKVEQPTQLKKPRLAQENHEAFVAMLRFYNQRFELGPLQSLVSQTLPYLIWNDVEENTTQSCNYKATLLPMLGRHIPVMEKAPLSPGTETLALLLRAYVRSLWRPYDLMAMYSFFKNRLRDPQGEGAAASNIVKEHGSFIHDSLILAMMQNHALVRPALEVFGDMLKDNHRDSETGIHPPPSVYTFSIILDGLGEHKQHKLFDNFKQIMEENSISPNLVTTNTFIKNYAKRQDVGLTVGALQDLETLGYRPNKFTYDAFAKLRNQKQALDMMSKIIDENQQRSLESIA